VASDAGHDPAEHSHDRDLSASSAINPKRWVLGRPLPSHGADEQLLTKARALPIFASDPLSSVAYAPQELLMILLGGGLAFLTLAPWVALCVVILLVVVVASYRQLIKAYPSGGGDYEVATKNLGEKPGLVVASALLIDYILTVAVSVASGVDNIISAVPALNPARVWIAVSFTVLLLLVNLRGVREASAAFSLPTYLFIASVALMVIVALVRTALGDPPVAESAEYAVKGQEITQAAFVLLLLRSFASGCSALTGVEAISNGVPAFRKPKVRNAQMTLVAMGAIAIGLFAGLTAVALVAGVHYAENPCELEGWAQCATSPQRSLMAQVAAATFGDNTILFFLIQVFTALVLLLAANTAFNGFPLLGSILARDGYAPKALTTRGDRLVFSNGLLILAVIAIVVLIVYQANVTNLIQLYIIGVFVSFTLGQLGMVVHWSRELRKTDAARAAIWPGLLINAFGCLLTALVLVVVTITKFTHGAWLVFAIMPVLFFLMLGVNRYYRRVAAEVAVDAETMFGSNRDHAIVLVGKMQKPVLKAIDYAIASKHDSLEAVTVSIDPDDTRELVEDWAQMKIHIPLRVIESPYRDIATPLIDYIEERREELGPEVVTVYLPQYMVGNWWEHILHNHRANRLRQRLMMTHGVMVALVPWRLTSSARLADLRPRPIPGFERRGIVNPPVREPQRPAAVRASSRSSSGGDGAR